MHNAPAVFVPTEPESNGITLPLVLSVLAHGLVIGLLIYTYQAPVIETSGSIETTIVSPEQLAEMQGQILANRAAAASSNASASTDASQTKASSRPNVYSSAATTDTQIAQPLRRRVPVFVPTDDPADARSILLSPDQQARYAEQAAEYERELAEWSAEQQALTDERLAAIEARKREEQQAEEDRLKAYRDKQNNPVKIKKPTRGQGNLEITTGDAAGSAKSFSLADGEPTTSATATGSSANPGSSRATGGGRGASDSQIISIIRRHYQPPSASKGSTQRSTLSITVNASGNIISVSASGPDKDVNDAARDAVLAVGSLPIDASDPKYPTFNIVFKGSN